MFYAEYNLRLFFYLLFVKADALCAIDLDTIVPVYYVSKIRNVKRIYDAHELFCEMKEVVTRPKIYAFWKKIERHTVPHFSHGYTVNQPIADAFKSMYGVNYKVIRNIARRQTVAENQRQNYILYQGAVNEGRSFETLIPAMQYVNAQLIICGDGNFMQQVKDLIVQFGLEQKVVCKGMLTPTELKNYTLSARVGITLFENNGLSNYYSLANRFFDYMQAGLPQLCVDYPVYREINDKFPVATLIPTPTVQLIAEALNELLANDTLWQCRHDACILASQHYNWENEAVELLSFYRNLF